MTTKKKLKYKESQNKIEIFNDLQKKDIKCYKKYCNKIITKNN